MTPSSTLPFGSFCRTFKATQHEGGQDVRDSFVLRDRSRFCCFARFILHPCTGSNHISYPTHSLSIRRIIYFPPPSLYPKRSSLFAARARQTRSFPATTSNRPIGRSNIVSGRDLSGSGSGSVSSSVVWGSRRQGARLHDARTSIVPLVALRSGLRDRLRASLLFSCFLYLSSLSSPHRPYFVSVFFVLRRK